MDYTPAEALEFAEEGRLVDWIEAFLNSAGGNPAFWEGLCLQPRWWQAPQQKPLSQLTRVSGPEPHMEYRQDEVVFEGRIQVMVDSLVAGWQPPPLIVEYRSPTDLSVRDGNHRHEALRRAGYESYWVVCWFNSEADYLTQIT